MRQVVFDGVNGAVLAGQLCAWLEAHLVPGETLAEDDGIMENVLRAEDFRWSLEATVLKVLEARHNSEAMRRRRKAAELRDLEQRVAEMKAEMATEGEFA